MPFAHLFENRDLLEGIRRLRANTSLIYAIAIGLVVVATLLRLVIKGEVPDTVPFTTYSLPLIVAAVLGGFGPGLLALFLAAVGGWFLFLPQFHSFAFELKNVWALVLFMIIGAVNVVILSALIASVLRRDEHQQFLRRELQHRSQNLFAVIQAIASRSLVEGQTLSAAKEAFNARIAALARTHRVFEDNAWSGAPLNQIALQELVGFANQITITGCDIPLNTPAAQNFALVLHELATNAVKHGALSSSEGRVRIEGTVEKLDGKGEFRFMWKESGGPSVTPPTRKGFGTTILFGTAKHFGQHVEAEYAPEGLTYNLVVLLNQIASSTTQLEITQDAETQSRFFPFRFQP